MTQDPNQTSQEEAVYERTFTEEEIESLAHPNIRVEDYQVTLKSIPSWIHIYILGLIYIIALIIAFYEGLAELNRVGVTVFAVSTPIFLICLLRLQVTTVFDRLKRTVHRRNLLHAMADIPFEQIAEIVMVNDMGPVYFKIAPQGDRLGKGFRITRNYDNRNEELLYMGLKALPAISEMLGARPESSSTQAAAGLAEHPLLYAKSGHIYTFTTWRNQGLALVIAGLMLTGSAYIDDWLRWLVLAFGVLAFLAVFLVTHRITIDVKEKSILFSTLSGLFNTSLPLSRYSGLSVVREHTNGLYTHTTVHLQFRDPDVSTDLYWAIWTKTLSALATETQAIIADALARPDEPGE